MSTAIRSRPVITFRGNRNNGLFAQFSQLTGVAFLNSTFNGNGVSGFGEGIFIVDSTIKSGQVKPVGIPAFNTGFTLQDSQAVGNFSSGVALIEATEPT